uniref:Snake venom serine protease KN13 n=1 Tax=Lygus hesperus TaxID=30085 RepID=A0A0A9WFB4_LYGHE
MIRTFFKLLLLQNHEYLGLLDIYGITGREMKNIFGVLSALVLARLSDCLTGGREMRLAEFPFLVKIENDRHVRCAGIIVDHLQVALLNGCVRRYTYYSIGYVSVNVIPVVNEDPPKKYKCWVAISEHSILPLFIGEIEIAIVLLEYPGMALRSRKDQTANLPSRAPFGPRTQTLNVPSEVIVLGIDGRVGTMTIIPEEDCHGLREAFRRTLYWMTTAKQFIGDNLICAVAPNDDDDFSRIDDAKPVRDIPPGQACEIDVGAPVVQKGIVIGLVVRAICSPVYMLHVTHILRLHSSDLPREKFSPELVAGHVSISDNLPR